MGTYLRDELEATIGDDVRDIRGQGLMLGIEVKRGANRMLPTLALDHGILALPAGRTVLRLLPPLIIEREHADQVVSALGEVIG
jgi:acetylornithine/LysW-gamma-L-lysine aminotransferase